MMGKVLWVMIISRLRRAYSAKREGANPSGPRSPANDFCRRRLFNNFRQRRRSARRRRHSL
ncbi:hypothetical protein LINPERPRIM_LOCUS33187, partial [Linum perenne]